MARRVAAVGDQEDLLGDVLERRVSDPEAPEDPPHEREVLAVELLEPGPIERCVVVVRLLARTGQAEGRGHPTARVAGFAQLRPAGQLDGVASRS
ncbi:MAG TPA: hypothetical protein VM869_06875 [Enhygromyxa sp.]|nr:hypothetical protein [Enhygromyxa sp.]